MTAERSVWSADRSRATTGEELALTRSHEATKAGGVSLVLLCAFVALCERFLGSRPGAGRRVRADEEDLGLARRRRDAEKRVEHRNDRTKERGNVGLCRRFPSSLGPFFLSSSPLRLRVSAREQSDCGLEPDCASGKSMAENSASREDAKIAKACGLDLPYLRASLLPWRSVRLGGRTGLGRGSSPRFSAEQGLSRLRAPVSRLSPFFGSGVLSLFWSVLRNH